MKTLYRLFHKCPTCSEMFIMQSNVSDAVANESLFKMALASYNLDCKIHQANHVNDRVEHYIGDVIHG